MKSLVELLLVFIMPMKIMAVWGGGDSPKLTQNNYSEQQDVREGNDIFSVNEIEIWIKNNAPWALNSFMAALDQNDSERAQFINGITELMIDYEEFSQSSKVSANLLLKIHHEESKLAALSNQLEAAGIKDEEEIRGSLKPIVEKIIPLQMQLDKEILKNELIEINKELRELDENAANLTEIVEEMLDEYTHLRKRAREKQNMKNLQKRINQKKQIVSDLDAFIDMERSKLKENPDYEDTFLIEALSEQETLRKLIESDQKKVNQASED